ncbi:hypothetical protein [Streptosporangium sp. NPDC051022]|uniref:hypothetical protein n=1 Tax=Streptosporangium sp. NPDC051022 TaxID=3155752 RepID=UPI00341B3550
MSGRRPRQGYALLRWIAGRPGAAGGWQLHLPGTEQQDGQLLFPPRRGLPPQEISRWAVQALTAHGWHLPDGAKLSPPLSAPFASVIPVLQASL